MLCKKHIRLFPAILLSGLTLILSSCATYYQKNLKFQEAFAEGKLEKANHLLDKNSRAAEDRNRLLYFMQKGVVLQMQGKYEESNEFFEKAYIFIEDHKRDIGLEALSLISNPTVKPYKGEDHEKVLIHYYKALNFLKLNQADKALVEARRLNNRLNLLNDTYENRKNRYSDDALAHLLMGIAYEMDGDVNNAFIAYRNSYNSYKELYAKEFGVSIPGQLKQDLLRTAYLNGFREELELYEREFNTSYKYSPPVGGELLFFWHNGLGPVKSEWSMNFTVIKGSGGMATFVNEDMGLNFSFPLPQNNNGSNGLGDLKLVRVAFPKYEARSLYYEHAKLRVDNSANYELEEVENINAIAFSILEDRMLRELGSSLLRLATKQAAEYALRQENEEAGAVLSVVNAFTEKADTRNWQTLPYSISYGRIPLSAGHHNVELITSTPNGQKQTVPFDFEVAEGEKVFHIFHSLENSGFRD